MCQIRHLGHVPFLFFALNLSPYNMGFQALIEVQHAADSKSNSKDDEDDGNDSKRGQGFPDWDVGRHLRAVVHPHQFEDEVRKSCEIEKL